MDPITGAGKGYLMDLATFEKFIKSLVDHAEETEDVHDLMTEYVGWRAGLPDKIIKKAPNLCCAIPRSSFSIEVDLTAPLLILDLASDPFGDIPTGIVFPLHLAIPGSQQKLKDLADPDIVTETEKDKAILKTWIHHANENRYGDGPDISADMFKFAVVSDAHPTIEWHNVSSLSLP
jgi:hypothetical protein